MEHAGFLAFAACMRGRPLDLVDANDLDFTDPGAASIALPPLA